MKNIVRTVYGSALQTSQLLGRPYTPALNSTLNEKFEVQNGVAIPNNEVPRLRYLAIGNGGHRNDAGADGQPITVPVMHRARDAALFKHLPFILREPGNDLDSATRGKYAMRKLITVNGVPWVAYYLKRLVTDNVNVTMMHNSVTDGVVSSVPFVPTGADLNPVQPAIPSSGAVSTSGNYLSTTAVLPLDFSSQDVAEVVQACKILFNNELYAVISEMALVSGVDKIVKGPGPGNSTIDYYEAIAAQVCAHISAHYPVGYTNRGFEYGLQMGATEPLIDIVAE